MLNSTIESPPIHFKPLSSHLLHFTQHLHATLYQLTPENQWIGRGVKILTTSLAVLGYAGSVPIALIESVVSVIFGISGTLYQTLIDRDSNRAQKYTLLFFSYALHSLVNSVLGTATVFNLYGKGTCYPKIHTSTAIIDRSTHIGTAATTHLFVGTFLNTLRGKENDLPSTNAYQIAIKATPDAFIHVAHSAQRDYTLLNEEPTNLREFIQNYIETCPNEAQKLDESFCFSSFIRGQTLGLLVDGITHYLETHSAIENRSIYHHSQNEITLNPYSLKEKRYQELLKTCVKNGVYQMMQMQWARFLSPNNDFNEGKELLESFYPGATIPLANIAQLIELRGRILCPSLFSHQDLKKYNNPSRNKTLKSLASTLSLLTSRDFELLVEKLIKLSDFRLNGRQIQNSSRFNILYQQICTLAAELHQGKLLTLATIDTESLECGAENFFAKAWGETLNEIQ
jgi:hypothetical protein